MKKLIHSVMAGVLFTLLFATANNALAVDPPYVDNVIIGGITTNFWGIIGGIDYDFYKITVVLDWPEPTVDELDIQIVDRDTSTLMEFETVYWPNPSNDLLLSESWNGYEHILELHAVHIEGDDPIDNIEVDNSYYFKKDGTTDYSYVCHGCYQAFGGVYIFNP